MSEFLINIRSIFYNLHGVFISDSDDYLMDDEIRQINSRIKTLDVLDATDDKTNRHTDIDMVIKDFRKGFLRYKKEHQNG